MVAASLSLSRASQLLQPLNCLTPASPPQAPHWLPALTHSLPPHSLAHLTHCIFLQPLSLHGCSLYATQALTAKVDALSQLAPQPLKSYHQLAS